MEHHQERLSPTWSYQNANCRGEREGGRGGGEGGREREGGEREMQPMNT